MSRWTAESDRDYYEQDVDGQTAPFEYVVACVSCSRDHYVPADARPPYRCTACIEAAAAQREAETLRDGERRV